MTHFSNLVKAASTLESATEFEVIHKEFEEVIYSARQLAIEKFEDLANKYAHENTNDTYFEDLQVRAQGGN